MVTCLLSCTVLEIWRIIGPTFVIDRTVSLFNAVVNTSALKRFGTAKFGFKNTVNHKKCTLSFFTISVSNVHII